MSAKDRNTYRSVRFAASVAVILGMFWIIYVVIAFAQEIPVYKHGNYIGNLNIQNYDVWTSNNFMKGGMKARFYPANNDMNLIDGLNLDWLQIVREDDDPPKDSNGNNLSPPYVDPPSGGYQGSPDDNKPPYWTNNERTNAINNNGNYFETRDYPSTPGNNLVFETYLVEIHGNNIEILDGFNWGMNRNSNGGTEKYPTTPGIYNSNNYPDDLNNIVNHDFPGWQIVSWSPGGIPVLSPFGLLILAALLFGLAIWLLSRKARMPSER